MNRQHPHEFDMQVLSGDISDFNFPYSLEVAQQIAHQSLVEETGVDLGNDAGAWKQWFRERSN